LETSSIPREKFIESILKENGVQNMSLQHCPRSGEIMTVTACVQL